MLTRCTVMFFVLALLPSATAQSIAERRGILPADDPRLYQAYFRFHTRLSSAIASRGVPNSQSRSNSEKAFANRIRVRRDELVKVDLAADALSRDLAKWESDYKTYVDRAQAQKQQPDAVVLNQFVAARRQLVMDAVQRLSTSLSPAGWAGLRSYINDEHRRHVKVMEFRGRMR